MQNQGTEKQRRRMALYALLIVVTTLAINLLSAYLRHVESGLGCDDWPDCYGRIESYVTADQAVAEMALAPRQTAKQIHRAVATALVVVVLLLVQQHRQYRLLTGAGGSLPYLMVAVLLVLSIIGPTSYLKTFPAIALVNLVGGMALAALAWWLWLQLRPPASVAASPGLRKLSTACLLALLAQICLGAWTSANFAGLSCPGLIDCGAGGSNLAAGSGAFWYFRELSLDGSGRVVFDQGALLIQLVHRAGALATAALLLWLGIAARRAGGALIMILLTGQLALGVCAVLFELPLAVVLGHNLVAALLLLATLRLVCRLSEETGG